MVRLHCSTIDSAKPRSSRIKVTYASSWSWYKSGSAGSRHQPRNRGRSLATLLDELATLRAANLETLAAWRLGDAELDLRARHPRLGPVTLRQLLAAWVVHDLGHIAQVVRVMAKQYRDEVGPWVQYLPVLTDHEAPRS